MNSYLYHVMVVPELNIANTISDSFQNLYLNQPNPERPPDTAVNIPHGRTPFRNNFNTPHSLSLSPMDSSPPSEVNYIERVATSNNQIDIEMSNLSIENTRHNLPQPMHIDNKAVPSALCQSDPSTLPVPLSTIPYEANALADPNLWDCNN